MKKATSYLILMFLALFVNGCFVTSRTKVHAPKSYTSVYAYNCGAHQYLTLNENDHQFYYSYNSNIEPGLIGSWKVCKDTLYLHPALMYRYRRGDAIATTLVNENDYEKEDYCPLKFLMRGTKGEILEDITDYSDVVHYTLWYGLYKDSLLSEQHRYSIFKQHCGEDSIIPVSSYENDFILSSDFEKLRNKWEKIQEKEEQKN